MEEGPILQVALDMADLHRAREIAKESVEGGVDWLEAGTPLIKSEGVEAIRVLKKDNPHKVLVADMKVADTGGFETELAAKAGADIVCLLGISDDETIVEAVRSGKQYGSQIMVDLLRVENKAERAKQVQVLGADYVCLHVGIDEQMQGGDPFKDIKAVVEAVTIPVAVAGGLNSETAAKVVAAGASIIIVGGAITKAPDVAEATRNLKEAMTSGNVVASELYKKYSQEDLREAFDRVSTCNIADAMHKQGAMIGITPRINPGTKMIGKARTVRTIDGDWAKAVEAVDRAEAGDVLVIDSGSSHTAVWGELASWSCRTKGIAGVVIDGAIRDIDEILKMNFPAFSRHLAPNAGEPKGHGEIGCQIVCGSQTVEEGDWIVGDETGVMVIPRARAVQIANRALDVHERENRLREEIKRGSTLSKVLRLEKWEKVD